MRHVPDPAADSVRPEFSRIVRADAVHRDEEIVETIEAAPAERAALAERFELEAIDRLTATVRLRSVRGGQMVRVTGTLDADVVQTCVVTLDPVPAHVSERFGALFAPESMIPKEEHELDIDPLMDEEDIPEPMANNRIDIGELTAQHLSLGLDPYPRAEGVEFAGFDEGIGEDDEEDEPEVEAEPEKPNPFAALERLKRGN